MKTRAITFAVLLAASASLGAQQTDGYQFTTVVNQKVTPVKTKLHPEHAGVSPLLRSSKPNCYAWAKVNTTFRKCLSSVKNT